MTIGVIQASSQTDKNSILFDAVKEYAAGILQVNGWNLHLVKNMIESR